MSENHKVHEFAAVQDAELKALSAGGEPLVGLALSGGGSRSATFNLGVLQALEADLGYTDLSEGARVQSSDAATLVRLFDLARPAGISERSAPGSAKGV